MCATAGGSGARDATARCWRRRRPCPDPEWSARPSASPLRPSSGPTPPRLPPGYRWIAVRPGWPRRRAGAAARSARPRATRSSRGGDCRPFRRHRSAAAGAAAPRPVDPRVRGTLIATMVVLGIAALMHVVRYALLIVNRSILLNPWVAGAATWLGVAASVIAMFMVVASAVVLTNWLIARRAAAFAYRGHQDPRSRVGAAGRLPGAVVQSGVGAGLRHRVGRCRGPAHLAAPPDRGVVAGVGGQHRGVGVLDRDQLHHRCAGHRQQHGDDDRRVSDGDWPPCCWR